MSTGEPTPTQGLVSGAAVEVGARAYAAGYGLDLDNLAASKDPGDTEADLAVWRANLVCTAREILEAAAPVLLADLREQLASQIEAAGRLRCPGCGELEASAKHVPTTNGYRSDYQCPQGHHWSRWDARMSPAFYAELVRGGTAGGGRTDG